MKTHTQTDTHTIILHDVDAVEATFSHNNNVSIAFIKREQFVFVLSGDPGRVEELSKLTHVESEGFEDQSCGVPGEGRRDVSKGVGEEGGGEEEKKGKGIGWQSH